MLACIIIAPFVYDYVMFHCNKHKRRSEINKRPKNILHTISTRSTSTQTEIQPNKIIPQKCTKSKTKIIKPSTTPIYIGMFDSSDSDSDSDSDIEETCISGMFDSSDSDSDSDIEEMCISGMFDSSDSDSDSDIEEMCISGRFDSSDSDSDRE